MVGGMHGAPDELTAARLLRMRQAELDELFRQGEPGPVPDGEVAGTFLTFSGARLGGLAANLVRRLAWQGKVFDAARGTVRNRVSPLGLPAVMARVREGSSRLDGKPCIVLDYAETSLVARPVRDELRCIRPGLYLGKAYVGPVRVSDFALEA
jgi:hypothetical protein